MSEIPYEIVNDSAKAIEIRADGRTLKLSNASKVMYPRTGFTKGDLVDYYARIAPLLLPHVSGRPLTLKRYPDGVEGEHFYQKHAPRHRPQWIRTVSIYGGRRADMVDYCLPDDLPTLIWLANLADIELHTSLSRAGDMTTPTAVVFDLDPGEPAGLRECCGVALVLRELFESFKLESVVKTSGSKGLQVYVPLNLPTSYEQTKTFAHGVALLLERRHPKAVVSRMAKALRGGKVLIDWSQNDQYKTTVAVYSLRARDRPTISTPLRWAQVQDAATSSVVAPLSLEASQMLERIDEIGDLFAPMLRLRQRLPDAVDEFDADAPRSRSAKFARAGDKGRLSTDRTSPVQGDEKMPPRGVKTDSKRGRQYEHIRQSERDSGESEARAEEIAARTVNKERARHGESRERSRSSVKDISSGRRGGQRSGRPGPRGPTKEQLYNEARQRGIPGRSTMSKDELQRAVDAKKRASTRPRS